MLQGNVTDLGDTYSPNKNFVSLGNGRKRVTLTGVALLTDTLQTIIPIKVYPTTSKNYSKNQPYQISVPVGGQILHASFRLPEIPLDNETKQFGRHLDKGTTIVGTSTDVIKIAGANNAYVAAKTASLASASSIYTIGATALLTRAYQTADDTSGILTTVASSALSLNIVCDNAANSAAGTGIKLSKSGAKAFIAVKVVYDFNDEPVDFEEALLASASLVYGGVYNVS